MYGISTIGFDSMVCDGVAVPSPELKLLHRIVTVLLDTLSRVLHDFHKLQDGLKPAESFSQVVLFLELVRATNRKDDLWVDQLFNVRMPVETHSSSEGHMDLYMKLKDDMREKENSGEYEVVNKFVGIRNGVFPVDIAIKKNGKVVEFREVDKPHHYRMDQTTGKKKLRRAEQLKEYLYRHNYPDVSFLRISELEK
jgi:hypothetical protein